MEINSVSILELTDPASATFVTLLGYYAPGDGGGGNFYWDSTVTNGNKGTIIESQFTSGSWIRIYTGSIYVVWFGAKGDGITDDTLAIQASLDSEASEICFGEKQTYKTSATLLISNSCNIELNNSSIKGISLSEIIKIASSNVTIKNGIIDLNGSSKNGIKGDGSTLGGLENFNLINVDIVSQNPNASNEDGGLYLTAFKNVHVKGGKYVDIFNSGAQGDIDHSPAIKFILCNYIWVDDVYINNVGVGINTYNSKHVFASGVKMEGVYNNGYYLQQESFDIDISGGCVNNYKDAGVAFKIDSDYATSQLQTSVRVRGVEFNNSDSFVSSNRNAAMRGIGLRRGSGLFVSNCVFINCGVALGQTSGFSGCSYVKFHDNLIINPRASSAITVSDADRIDIHHNTIHYINSNTIIEISELTSSGTTATAITSQPHNLTTGDQITISGADQTEYNVINAVVTVLSANSFTYSVPAGTPTPASGTIIATPIRRYILRFNSVTNSTVTDNKIYGNNMTLYGLSLNSSDSIIISNNVITGVTNKFQNVSGSSTNIIYEQDGATTGQYPSYLGISSHNVTSTPNISLRSTNTAVTQGDYIGVLNFYSADISEAANTLRASLGVRATNSLASQHQFDFSINGIHVATINQNGDLKALTGNVEISGINKGLIMASPDGTRYKVVVNNAGALVVSLA